MVAKRAVRLGQEAFVLSPEGKVVRTMVARIEEDGYQLLNGTSEHSPHWFTFNEAIFEASARIGTRQTALRKALRELARKRRALETQDYQDGVMNAPYKVVDLRDAMDFSWRRRSRGLKKVRVPEEYQIPGSMVYVIITPMTHPKFDGMGVYRPHKHFVLETKVTSVCFSPDGKIHYAFSTPFVVEEFSLYHKDATAKLSSFSEPGTKEPTPFVSHKQEEMELKNLVEDDIPF